jgi:septal ring factor EnvC (AmiA/AmiB activator)
MKNIREKIKTIKHERLSVQKKIRETQDSIHTTELQLNALDKKEKQMLEKKRLTTNMNSALLTPTLTQNNIPTALLRSHRASVVMNTGLVLSSAVKVQNANIDLSGVGENKMSDEEVIMSPKV